ncbi:recombination directionality factor [Nitrosomonas supralitoralis]|uniref:Hydrolase or metal-binding protein n=1 Tax=Nitrosomonas supralitoralis TaxID=2116706 RepID=A0A2P7NRX0_9PROT|nr:hydrolase or metal-binding protein [Nitrosomonas supralitoralis]PSJ16204.1 hydrolase or metal-binding protein [Nitrosomonas supralitoralis]
MLKGLALTPPVIGRITIGKIVEKNGKRLPEKDDEFTITSQIQNKDGWINHPLNEKLRKEHGNKLRSIPVRLLFDDPDLNLRSNYSLFDRQTGRPVCVGNGETCRRATKTGIQSFPCPAPESCELAKEGHCKPYGRLNVIIENEDELGSFVFRTTGFNSIRTLSTRLKYLHAVSGELLSTLPLELRLRGKSTTQSHRTPIYYVDLTVRNGMTIVESIANAKTLSDERKSSGFNQAALDEAAKLGFDNGAFEDSEEEGVAVVEEFYSDDIPADDRDKSENRSDLALAAKLGKKVEQLKFGESAQK